MHVHMSAFGPSPGFCGEVENAREGMHVIIHMELFKVKLQLLLKDIAHTGKPQVTHPTTCHAWCLVAD